MKYKLFISDYDRTLGDRSYVDPSTVEKIKEFEKKGGKFVIVSGRVIDSICRICRMYGFTGLVGAYQGGMIKNLDTDEILVDEGVRKDIAISVVKDFIKERFDFTVDIGGVRYSVKVDGVYLDYYEKFGGAVVNVVTPEEVLEVMQSTDKTIEKVCAMISPDDIYPKIDEYNKKYPNEVSFNSGGPIILECINAKYDKGSAVRFIADYYGVPLSEVITIGDSTNDVPLVNGEWYGVAVGNGCDHIKKEANEVTVEFKDNPVKTILEKYCL